jgi:hypothetical protein
MSIDSNLSGLATNPGNRDLGQLPAARLVLNLISTNRSFNRVKYCHILFSLLLQTD